LVGDGTAVACGGPHHVNKGSEARTGSNFLAVGGGDSDLGIPVVVDAGPKDKPHGSHGHLATLVDLDDATLDGSGHLFRLRRLRGLLGRFLGLLLLTQNPGINGGEGFLGGINNGGAIVGIELEVVVDNHLPHLLTIPNEGAGCIDPDVRHRPDLTGKHLENAALERGPVVVDDRHLLDSPLLFLF